jgi:Zn-dependent peptidase ImmA (M78 family)
LDIPFRTYADIKQEAMKFLSKFHPSHSIPIPIETIIDVQLGLNIFPFPRLYKDHGQNGYLSKDRTTIYVDDLQYDQFNEKYRFTIAHELGHYVLHEYCYEQIDYLTCENYVEWRLSVEPEKIGWLDTHAQWFAGCILVPTKPLKKHCFDLVEKHKSKFLNTNLSMNDFLSYASNEIARYFEVSPPVIETQIKKENISKELSFR